MPYVQLFDTLEQSLPIKSIIVGPHPKQQQQAEAVLLALETQDIKAQVRLSSISYRN